MWDLARFGPCSRKGSWHNNQRKRRLHLLLGKVRRTAGIGEGGMFLSTLLCIDQSAVPGPDCRLETSDSDTRLANLGTQSRLPNRPLLARRQRRPSPPGSGLGEMNAELGHQVTLPHRYKGSPSQRGTWVRARFSCSTVTVAGHYIDSVASSARALAR
ncbi:hypothetical protein N657DRAFT_650587 [Parathielavia appendiculata]|uniref:Uncharacterized protein n=1 Tax=Parathielavia appendiculata TaxID=2587402 RepID=A0AAN6YZ78_9PEZI|nr:hypothetical protein N657DRAFT_650587 [Parathielavia appendiculata]